MAETKKVNKAYPNNVSPLMLAKIKEHQDKAN